MGRALIFLAGGLIASLLQGMLLFIGLPAYLLPQLAVLLVVCLAFVEVSVLGAFIAFGLGLVLDFSSALLIIGPWAGAFVTVYACLALLSQRLFVESGVVAVVTSFLAVLIADTLYMILAYEYRPVSWDYPTEALGQALTTAVIAPLVLGFLTRRLRKKSTASLGRGGALSIG
jgi:cell shape-determining protein MreD